LGGERKGVRGGGEGRKGKETTRETSFLPRTLLSTLYRSQQHLYITPNRSLDSELQLHTNHLLPFLLASSDSASDLAPSDDGADFDFDEDMGASKTLEKKVRSRTSRLCEARTSIKKHES